MGFKPTEGKQRQAFTLVEILVAIPLGMLLIAGMVSLYCYTTRSFASLTSYTIMDQKTRYAGDYISRDVRCASSVDDTTSSNKLVLNMPVGGRITYLYDPNGQMLVRSNSLEVRQLLTNVISLSFSLYQRPSAGVAGYESLPAATPGSAKLIGFSWKTARRVVGSEWDSQDAQAAIVELRNQ